MKYLSHPWDAAPGAQGKLDKLLDQRKVMERKRDYLRGEWDKSGQMITRYREGELLSIAEIERLNPEIQAAQREVERLNPKHAEYTPGPSGFWQGEGYQGDSRKAGDR